MSEVIDSFYVNGVHLPWSNFFWHDDWTVEHDYQAAKTDDPEWKARILRAPTPGRAKKLGRECPMRPKWDDEKLTVMQTLLYRKFEPWSDLAKLLVATGDAEMIEGNTWGDTFWGVCKGRGENHLGRMLMGVRETLNLLHTT